MSILKKKAQAKKNTKVITARIPEELYDSFKNLCDENGFSINEALKVLIENELESIQNVYTDEEESAINFEEPKEEVNYDRYDFDETLVSEYPDVPFGQPFDLGHRVIKPEETLKTITKDDLDPNDPLEARMLKMYEEYGD